MLTQLARLRKQTGELAEKSPCDHKGKPVCTLPVINLNPTTLPVEHASTL